MGPERQVASALPCRAGDVKQQPALAAAARVCVRDTTGRRVRLDPTPSPAGAGQRSPKNVAAASRQRAESDSRAERRWRRGDRWPGGDSTGGDRHRPGSGRYRLCAELQSDNGLWRLALCFISAVQRCSAYRLLFRHRVGHRACFRCRCRGGRRPMGLGEARMGRGLRQRQRQQLEQHQREPRADLVEPVPGKRRGQPVCELRPRAQRPGRTAWPFPGVGAGKRRATPNSRRRCWRRRRYRRCGSARRTWRRGRYRRCGSAGRTWRRGRYRRCRSAGRAWGRRRYRRCGSAGRAWGRRRYRRRGSAWGRRRRGSAWGRRRRGSAWRRRRREFGRAGLEASAVSAARVGLEASAARVGLEASAARVGRAGLEASAVSAARVGLEASAARVGLADPGARAVLAAASASPAPNAQAVPLAIWAVDVGLDSSRNAARRAGRSLNNGRSAAVAAAVASAAVAAAVASAAVDVAAVDVAAADAAAADAAAVGVREISNDNPKHSVLLYRGCDVLARRRASGARERARTAARLRISRGSRDRIRRRLARPEGS